MIKINNLPRPAKEMRNYIVARPFDGRWWYFGTWDEQELAVNAALEVDGQVFRREDIE